MLEYYPHSYHHTDRKGRPFYIECMGRLNIEKLFQVSTEDRVLRHYIQSYELLLKLRFPACSAVAGHRIEQGLTVVDLHGGTSKIFSKKV